MGTSMNDMEREMAKLAASSIRLRLKVARDERWMRWAVGVTSVVAGAAFLWRGEYGFAAMLFLAAFYYCIAVPVIEAASRRAGWQMAWMSAISIVSQHPGVDRDLVQQIHIASRMPGTEEAELAEARFRLQQLEQMLKEDDRAAE